MNSQIERNFLDILGEELIPAMGCTEPIALAYAAAKMREILGAEPESILAKCSGNIIKNVRCVKIPHSNGMVGIEAAAVLGAFGGDANQDMEVLKTVTSEDIRRATAFIEAGYCRVEFLDSEIPLHFVIEGHAGSDRALVEVRHSHMNIARIEKNDDVLLSNDGEASQGAFADRSALNLQNIKDFADQVALEKIAPFYDRVMHVNMDIAYEGMTGKYGVAIGRMLRETSPDSVFTRMRAFAAAASEARMGGCDMPVIITSGSGNQGIASTVPVIVYGLEKGFDKEKIYRALAFSSLLTIFQKEYIGKLSAFCGAVSASCASGAAITYLMNGTLAQIRDTILNTLADVPGMICDGAKTSCAIKIASCLDAAFMAHNLAMRGSAYEPHTGILRDGADETISCVGAVGRIGMRDTDREILRMMLEA